MFSTLFTLLFYFNFSVSATKHPVLVGSDLLNHLGYKPLVVEETLGVSAAMLTPAEIESVTRHAHDFGRCGGLEWLPEEKSPASILADLSRKVKRDRVFAGQLGAFDFKIEKSDRIVEALGKLKAQNVRTTVEWLSRFRSRYHKGPQANTHVQQFYDRLKSMGVGIEVSLISHQRTPQKSIRVRIPGTSRANEVIVLGGHLDSIAGFFGGSGPAPGADDNASGSACLVEVLRVLREYPVKRTVDFFWYAGEEGGLIGSSEIAEDYKRRGEDVIGVVQLDMTAHAGDGSNTIGVMDDFTSSWLTGYLKELNELYIGATVKHSECGYGCSDHASWYRQGFPTVMPHESSFSNSNPHIHTRRDTITGGDLDFSHALIFAKLSLALALDLGNSQGRQPY